MTIDIDIEVIAASMETLALLYPTVLAGLLSASVAYLYIGAMKQWHIYETPNARSSHSKPLLTGGGWIVVLVTLLFWYISFDDFGKIHFYLCAAVLSLAAISWIDDLSPLSPIVRLIAQLFAIAIMLSFVPAEKNILFDRLPVWADRGVVALGWLWFVNLFNFMDGIDGMAGVETIVVAVGTCLVGYVVGLEQGWILLSLLLAAAACGFLFWNWFPAKIILGDVGSIPIGFITGWLLIQLALEGHLVPALILPVVFCADATITLAKRILNGDQFWRPHRLHLYQGPAVAGLPHSAVMKLVIAANLLIIPAALAAIYFPLLGTVFSVCIVGVLFTRFRQISQSKIGPG